MVGVTLRDQISDNRYSVCCNGLCYGHRRARRWNDDGDASPLENDEPGRVQNYTGLVNTMTIDFAGVTDGDDEPTAMANDIARAIEKAHPDLINDLNASGIIPPRFVQIVLDAVESLGYDLTDYDDDDDDDEFDDMDDFEDEDDEDDEDEFDDEDEDEDARAGRRHD